MATIKDFNKRRITLLRFPDLQLHYQQKKKICYETRPTYETRPMFKDPSLYTLQRKTTSLDLIRRHSKKKQKPLAYRFSILPQLKVSAEISNRSFEKRSIGIVPSMSTLADVAGRGSITHVIFDMDGLLLGNCSASDLQSSCSIKSQY